MDDRLDLCGLIQTGSELYDVKIPMQIAEKDQNKEKLTDKVIEDIATTTKIVSALVAGLQNEGFTREESISLAVSIITMKVQNRF